MTTKHEAALRALEELERRATTGVWSAGKPDTNVSNWKLAATIRDALTAQGEAEKRLAGAAKLLVCGACGERPDSPAWRWAYGDSYRNGHIVGGPVPDLCGPVVFALVDPAPSAAPAHSAETEVR